MASARQVGRVPDPEDAAGVAALLGALWGSNIGKNIALMRAFARNRSLARQERPKSNNQCALWRAFPQMLQLSKNSQPQMILVK